MNPDEFYEYTMEEFLVKVEGARKVLERDMISEWQQTRRICYFVVASQLGKKTPREHELFPLPGDIKKRRSRLAAMTPEERQEWTKAVREDMISKGYTTDN